MVLSIKLLLSCPVHVIVKGEDGPGNCRKLDGSKLNTDRQEILNHTALWRDSRTELFLSSLHLNKEGGMLSHELDIILVLFPSGTSILSDLHKVEYWFCECT